MPQDTAARLATQLMVDTAAGTPHASLRHEGAPLPLPLAYDVQHHFVVLQQAGGAGGCAGYKVGLTNPAMQRMCGVDQPVAGQILADRVFKAPGQIALSRFVRLGIESELAVRLACPLPILPEGADYGLLLDCIDAVATCFELVEDRNADYSALDACSIVAENSWNRGIVLGAATAPSRLANLAGLAGTLYIDDEAVAHGGSADVMGGPLNVLAWLARAAPGLGYRTEPGQWIATGAIIPTKFPRPGQLFRFELADLPAVTVALE